MERLTRKVKDALPKELRRTLLQKRSDLSTLFASVEAESRYTNIYHCCVQKTASQWLRRIFADKTVYRYSGLRWAYFPAWLDDSTLRPIIQNPPSDGFPRGKIVSPVYMDHETFASMEKPESYRAFFVKRDPRDIVVSFYFSTLHAHLENAYIGKTREKLKGGGEEEGLMAAIDELEEFLFPSLRSWEQAREKDPSVSVWKFEDLTSTKNRYESFRILLNDLDISIPDREFDDLMERYAFQSLSGRSKGEEDLQSSFRKGVQGDWENHFTPTVQEYYEETTDNIHQHLGYGVTST